MNSKRLYTFMDTVDAGITIFDIISNLTYAYLRRTLKSMDINKAHKLYPIAEDRFSGWNKSMKTFYWINFHLNITFDIKVTYQILGTFEGSQKYANLWENEKLIKYYIIGNES